MQLEPKLQLNLQELASTKQDNVACFKTKAALRYFDDHIFGRILQHSVQ